MSENGSKIINCCSESGVVKCACVFVIALSGLSQNWLARVLENLQLFSSNSVSECVCVCSMIY